MGFFLVALARSNTGLVWLVYLLVFGGLRKTVERGRIDSKCTISFQNYVLSRVYTFIILYFHKLMIFAFLPNLPTGFARGRRGLTLRLYLLKSLLRCAAFVS